MNGSPFGEISTPETAAPQAPAPAAVQPAQPPKQIVMGDKIFNSESEALAYAQGLEEQRALLQRQQSLTPAANLPRQPGPGDVLFEDPNAAFRLNNEQLLQQLDARDAKKRAHDNMWADFYGKHTDLKGNEEAVEFIKTKHWEAIKNQPTNQSLPFLAAETRAYLSRMRGSASVQEHVPSKPAMVAGASGPTPPAPATPISKPVSWVDELKQMRKKSS